MADLISEAARFSLDLFEPVYPSLIVSGWLRADTKPAGKFLSSVSGGDDYRDTLEPTMISDIFVCQLTGGADVVGGADRVVVID